MILPLYVFFHCLIPIPIQHVEELSVQAYYTLHHKVLYCTIFFFFKLQIPSDHVLQDHMILDFRGCKLAEKLISCDLIIYLIFGESGSGRSFSWVHKKRNGPRRGLQQASHGN